MKVAVIGAGVVGCATALALARRGAEVVLLEAEPEPGLAASGTNSGVLHTGFDSPPGELETELILRATALRESSGALGRPDSPLRGVDASRRRRGERGDREVGGQRRAQRGRGQLDGDGSLEIPGESVTDPVAFTTSLAAAAGRHGAALRTGFAVARDRSQRGGIDRLPPAAASPCAVGWWSTAPASAPARSRALLGDRSFEVYPRKGEFLVFEPPGERLDRILLPVPSKQTKGVLVFPTLDGKVIAGPTAIDQEDPEDWSVRPQAREEILPKAIGMLPQLEGAEPIAAYAGLRPAGRGVNYLIGPSPACPELINVAAIRSTGLTASLGDRRAGLRPRRRGGYRARRPEAPLAAATEPAAGSFDGPWWLRTAVHRGEAAM